MCVFNDSAWVGRPGKESLDGCALRTLRMNPTASCAGAHSPTVTLMSSSFSTRNRSYHALSNQKHLRNVSMSHGRMNSFSTTGAIAVVVCVMVGHYYCRTD